MIKTIFRSIAVFVSSGCLLLSAAAVETSESALSKFFESLAKADKGAAMKQLKVFPEFPGGYLESKIERLIESTKSNGTPKLIRSKEMNSIAVVIIDEKPANGLPDYDPIYLLKDGEDWKVTINMKFDETSRIKVPETVGTEYKALREWYTAIKAELKADKAK